MLAGLEILSKVFDQQSSSTVSKILQQVRGIWGHSSGSPLPWGAPTDPTVAPSIGAGKAVEKHPPSQIASGLLRLGEALAWVWGSHPSAGVSCWGF